MSKLQNFLMISFLLVISILLSGTLSAQTASCSNGSKIEKTSDGYKVSMVVTPKAATTLLTKQIKSTGLPATITVGSTTFEITGGRGNYQYNGQSYKSLTDMRKQLLTDLRKELNIN